MDARRLEFRELTPDEFAKTRFKSASFLQSVEMFRRYQALGREAYLIGVVEQGMDAEGAKKAQKRSEKGKIVAAGLVLMRNWHFGKKIMTVPGGWLIDYDRSDWREILKFLTSEMRKFAREYGAMMVRISPNITSEPRDNENQVALGKNYLDVKRELMNLGYKYLGESEQVKWEYVLELPGKTPEDYIMEIRTTHRQLIRKAERDGVRVRELRGDELGVLKKIAAESGERHGFRDPEVEYYQSMKDAFGEKVKFLVAEIPEDKVRKEDRVGVRAQNGFVPLAASMFVDDGREVVYLYSGSVRKLQRYNGVYAIQWRMITEAMKNGRERYNFYGVLPVAGNGVYRFKQGFRGHVEELLGTFVLPVGLLGALYVKRLKTQEYGEIA